MSVKLTRDQVKSRKEKAVRFVRDVLGDSDRADEIESESVVDYAARRKIAINPRGGVVMAKKTETREELKERISELEGENESLQDQLDAIADIVVPAEEEDDDEDGEESDDEDE
jgi:hypothetical protein